MQCDLAAWMPERNPVDDYEHYIPAQYLNTNASHVHCPGILELLVIVDGLSIEEVELLTTAATAATTAAAAGNASFIISVCFFYV